MKRIILVMLFVFLLVGCDSDNKSASDKINDAVETKEIDTQNEDNNLEQDGVNITRMNPYTADDNGYCANFDVVKFGSFEQDGDENNGTEAIEWYVIAKEDGKVLLLSRYVLRRMPYDSSDNDITWEECELRSWLNNDFYNTSFIDNEKQLIKKSHLINNDNIVWETLGGSDTDDNVFILSLDEIAKYFTFSYANAVGKNYDYASEDLFSSPTFVAYENISYDKILEYTQEIYNENSERYGFVNEQIIGTDQPAVWVRTPGGRKQWDVCTIRCGLINEDIYRTCGELAGVRPAIWVDEAALTMYQ